MVNPGHPLTGWRVFSFQGARYRGRMSDTEKDGARMFFETLPKRRGGFNNEEIKTVLDWVNRRLKHERNCGQGSIEEQFEWFWFLVKTAQGDTVSGPRSLLKHALLWWASKTKNKFGKSYREGWDNGHWAGSFFTTQRLKERATKKAAGAGRTGAAEKHRPANELKLWAKQHAKSIKGSDMMIARALAARIPSHLSAVSKNPERLIYETLRKAPKPD